MVTNHERDYDRQAVLADLKARIIQLSENPLQLPDVAWDAEPVRYFKLNLQWCKLLAGWLDWLEDVAGWPDATNDAFEGIQGFLAFEEGIDLPELDCNDIENCLETSPTITNIENNITNIENNITNITNAQAECCETASNGGNVYPDPPEQASEGNKTCESAAYIAAQLKTQMLELWDAAQILTLQEFIDGLTNIFLFNFPSAIGFYQYALTIADPTLGADAAAYEEDIKLALFCADLNIEEAKEIIQESPIPSNEKALWIAVMDNFTQGQYNDWIMLGSLGETNADCSDGCPWIVVWDFDGSYQPLGNEDAIYSGDTWMVEGGGYLANVGYQGLVDDWNIKKNLPQQCKVWEHHWNVNRNSACLAVDMFRLRADGEWGNSHRVLSETPVDWPMGAINEVQTQIGLRHNHFICGSPPMYGSQIHYAILIGSGAMPTG